jgi:mRNA interferase RelE/StbE
MYSVELKPQAQKFIEAQPGKIQRQLVRKIESLVENPHPAGSKLLHGEKKLYRIRSGDYRIVYQIQHENLLILIVKVGHRKDVYERLSR